LLHYCVTEMVNNVIDHSEAKTLSVTVTTNPEEAAVNILDDGVGIFRKLERELKLEGPRHVALELAKGKLTTDPDRHTGEGIFFSARMCDRFLMESANVVCGHFEDGRWLVDEDVSHPTPFGTAVLMAVRLDTRRTPRQVFDALAPPGLDHDFTRTEIPADLAGPELVSRSQAKRLLARCEQFQEVTLDFSRVTGIAPAFADEAFRVWPDQHPGVLVRHSGANETVRGLIERALRNGGRQA
jgi:anti-sigma regulatory factor (Ser/Thr protein kinase)